MKTTVLLTLGLLSAVHAAQAGDPVAGEKLSKPCASCHGPDGNSLAPNFPKLAGQHEDYLVQALQDYKSGARQNPIMKGLVSGLTEQDIEDLAAYFSQQKGLVSPEAE
jgi:cytochrome c553